MNANELIMQRIHSIMNACEKKCNEQRDIFNEDVAGATFVEFVNEIGGQFITFLANAEWYKMCKKMTEHFDILSTEDKDVDLLKSLKKYREKQVQNLIDYNIQNHTTSVVHNLRQEFEQTSRRHCIDILDTIISEVEKRVK